MKDFFLSIKKALENTRFPQVPAFCGDTAEQIKSLCATSGACVCVSFEEAHVGSANASFRFDNRAFSVYYACALSRASTGEHLDDIKAVFSALHALRIGNCTLRPEDCKLIDRGSVLVYALNFKI